MCSCSYSQKLCQTLDIPHCPCLAGSTAAEAHLQPRKLLQGSSAASSAFCKLVCTVQSLTPVPRSCLHKGAALTARSLTCRYLRHLCRPAVCAQRPECLGCQNECLRGTGAASSGGGSAASAASSSSSVGSAAASAAASAPSAAFFILAFGSANVSVPVHSH